MAAPTRKDRGFTRLELLVILIVIAVIFLLVALAIPRVGAAFAQRQFRHNAGSIHMATMSMAMDGATNKDASLGWPGDLKEKGYIATLGDYANVMVRSGYLLPGDLKIFCGPGCKPYRGTLSSGSNGVLVPAFTDENSAYKVYLDKDTDPSNRLFLASKNYTYNTPLDNPNAHPFGDRYFLLLHKGGNVAILKKQQAQSHNLIGELPGGGNVESAENCLNPR